MSHFDHRPLDPSHRMVLAIQYDERGGLADVEAIAVPTWRDNAADATVYDPALAPLADPWWDDLPSVRPGVGPGPLPCDEDVTLLFVHGARLVLRFDDARTPTG